MSGEFESIVAVMECELEGMLSSDWKRKSEGWFGYVAFSMLVFV